MNAAGLWSRTASNEMIIIFTAGILSFRKGEFPTRPRENVSLAFFSVFDFAKWGAAIPSSRQSALDARFWRTTSFEVDLNIFYLKRQKL